MASELLVRILASELPLDGALLGVSILLPSIDLASQRLRTGNAPIQALAGENADLDLRHVQPARMLGRVVELHPAQ